MPDPVEPFKVTVAQARALVAAPFELRKDYSVPRHIASTAAVNVCIRNGLLRTERVPFRHSTVELTDRGSAALAAFNEEMARRHGAVEARRA